MITGRLRRSHWINRKPTANVHHATRHAQQIGLPLNNFVTINFAELGVEPERASEALQKIICQRYSPWLRRTAANDNLIVPTYVWTIENGGGRAAAHWLLHIPKALFQAFETKLGRWLNEICVGAMMPQAVEVKEVYEIKGLSRYILKGADPHYGQAIGINTSDQGVVFGKRSGFSRNLGPTARKSAGYRSKPFRIYVKLS